MPVTITRVRMWQTEIPNRPGVLAETLEPLAHAGADLAFVRESQLPARPGRARIDLVANTGRRVTRAARTAGFSVSATPALLVEGENRPGLAYAIANAVAWAGIALTFLSAQVIGERYAAVLGFRSDGDARKARAVIRKVAEGAA